MYVVWKELLIVFYPQMERVHRRGRRYGDVVTAVAVKVQRTRTQYENHCWKDHRFLDCGVLT